MSNRGYSNEILNFNNSEPIKLTYEKTVKYSNVNHYDQKLMSQSFIWHQIVVHHNGKVSFDDGKKLILDAIFDIVGNEEFFPVGYRRVHKQDRFLVRQCTPAMDKLFARNLRIRLLNGMNFNLEVQLNVAEYTFQQISPKIRLEMAVNRLCYRLENDSGLLNLSNFDENLELTDLEIRLSNPKTLEYICDLIYQSDEHFRHIKGIILSHNGIRNLTPLQIFRGSAFTLLDLRYNNLESIPNLCRDLQNVRSKKLLLAGNPITSAQDYPQALSPLAKNFKYLDEIPFNNLSQYFTPATREHTSNNKGYRIETDNRADIEKFENSQNWHAVMIPDVHRQFTKDEIFDYFFLQVSKELETVYPCYYKYVSGEHQFLLRNCFQQIVHFVEISNLEIKIPNLNFENGQNDYQITYENTLNCYLLMDIGTYNQGDIDPIEVIQKALSQRFNVIDRILDLEKFQTTPGLENIIINMSSAMVLLNVMSIAARKFSSSCVEIRLCQNKILSVNFAKPLFLMANVKAIDLGNNWIYDLQDIANLQAVKLKAIRLDGNPLCSKYSNPTDYIEAVKQLFPEIHKLDNVEIKTTGNINCHKNYICDVEVYDFVEQFVPSFFNTFQSEDRKNLAGLYHPNASFSLTCKYKPIRPTPQNMKRREKYRKYNRNVLCLEDMAIARDNIFIGHNDIAEVFTKLPDMSFDLLSFTIDVPISNNNIIVLMVSGIFSDIASCLLEGDIIMGFTRTFVLTSDKSSVGVLKLAKSYKIINDLLSVYNASELQMKNSFKYSKKMESNGNEEITVADKEALLIMFQELSGLKSIWCTRCLGDANWNFEEAIEVFSDLCTKKEIPETAFL